MRKARKKAVSIIVALTFLLGLVFAYAGPAAAADYTKYSGAFDYVEAGTNQPAGYAQVDEYQSNSWDSSGTIYVTVTLPSGVSYTKEPKNDANFSKYAEQSGTGSISFYSATKTSLTVTVAATVYTDGVRFKFDEKDYSALNIDSGVSGDIKATIEVMQLGADKKIKWVESGTVTIARVAPKAVTVTAGTPIMIQPGTLKNGATITIREGVAGSLSTGEWVYGRIDTAGVSFNVTEFVYSDVKASGVAVDSSTFTATLDSNKRFAFKIGSASSGVPGNITIDLTKALDVQPSVTGDIKITIYGAGTTKIPTTTLTVATVGSAAVNITDVKNTGATLYAGYGNAQAVEVAAGSAQFKLKSTGTTLPAGVVTLELSAGKFGSLTTDPSLTVRYYPDYKTAWFEIPSGFSGAELTIKDFQVILAGDTPAGDLKVKVGGTIGVSGEVVLAKVVKPFTVTAAATPQILYPGQAQAAGDLVIKEASAGVVKDGKLIVKLPANITFNGTPSAKVTEGDLGLGTVALNVYGELEIPINRASVLASTITISGIKYDVSRLALEGDVEVQVYGSGGSWDGKTIAKVVNAKVVAPQPPAPPSTKREASFVIGSTTYKVNGKDSTMDVAPYIDAASGRTYLPVRYVAYALGVSEDNIFYSNGVVSLLKDGRAVQMTIGSKALVVNGVTITMDAAPVIKDGRTMLPFRWIATALGASVKWDEATKTVTMVIE